MILYLCGHEIRYYDIGGDSLEIEKAIREYLISHGIKQSFIAEKCAWTKQKVNAILTGKQKINADDYGAICEAVDVPYDHFYNVVAAAQDDRERR